MSSTFKPLALAGAVFAFAAPAQALTGTELLSACHDPLYYSQCYGYIQGVVDTMAAVRASAGFPNCPVGADNRPPTYSEVVNVAVRAISANPQRSLVDAAALVAIAMFTAWKCPNPVYGLTVITGPP